MRIVLAMLGKPCCSGHSPPQTILVLKNLIMYWTRHTYWSVYMSVYDKHHTEYCICVNRYIPTYL